MGQKGITLLEMVVTVGIIAILLAVAVFQYSQWVIKYNTERQAKGIYGDMVELQLKAMERNVQYIVSWTEGATGYNLCQDTNKNGTCDNGEAVPGLFGPSGSKAALHPSGSVTINEKGLISPATFLRIDNSNDAEFDCVLFEQTKVAMGAYDGTKCVEK